MRTVIERFAVPRHDRRRVVPSVCVLVVGQQLQLRDERRILTRTCFSIEPGIYLEGRFGVRSECDVYVDEERVRVTGPLQEAIIPLVV